MRKKVEREKRAFGGATRRKTVSLPVQALVETVWRGNPIHSGKRVLDFGCGYGTDASAYGWEKYDPFYFPTLSAHGPYDVIVSVNVVHSLCRKRRDQVLLEIQKLLGEEGAAFLSVPRNLPIRGKLSGYHRRVQNYVVLSLPVVYRCREFEIYRLDKHATWKDQTLECL